MRTVFGHDLLLLSPPPLITSLEGVDGFLGHVVLALLCLLRDFLRTTKVSVKRLDCYPRNMRNEYHINAIETNVIEHRR